jgi:hypothetical protein
VFQRKFDNIDAWAIYFLLDHICCFELTHVMRKIDDQFIKVVNRFRIATHNLANITLLNHACLCLPPSDLNFFYMYYTNKSTNERNDFVFQNTKRQEYVFDVNDQHNDTCLKLFKLENDSSQTVGLHSKIQIKIGMLIKLCAIHDGLSNGVDGVFQYVTKLQNNESFIWIGFNNPKIGFVTRIRKSIFVHNPHS